MGRILRASRDGKHLFAGHNGTNIHVFEAIKDGAQSKTLNINNDGDEIYDYLSITGDRIITLRKNGEVKLIHYDLAKGTTDLKTNLQVKINALTDEFANALALSEDSKYIAVSIPVEDAGFHTSKIVVYEVDKDNFSLRGELDLNAFGFGKCSSMAFVETSIGDTTIVALCDANPENGMRSKILTLNFNRKSGFLTEVESMRKDIDADNPLMILNVGGGTVISIDAEGRFMTVKY